MNINTYLEYLQEDIILQEIDIKTMMKMPKEKIKKSLKNIKGSLDSNNISKLKSIIRNIPKVKFEKIEKIAKEKIKNFNSLYSYTQKELSKNLDFKKDEIKQSAMLLTLSASIDKNPKSKLNSLLKKSISYIDQDSNESQLELFIRGSVFITLASLMVFFSGLGFTFLFIIWIVVIAAIESFLFKKY